MLQPVPIRFHLLHPFYFPHRRKVKELLLALMHAEGKQFASLDYIFCSDEYLLQINREFLNHDYLTDIISFNLAPESDTIAGEIYISVERVKENAKEFKQLFFRELLRVILHGALHLSGYGDSSATEIKVMRAKEEEYLKML